MHATIGRPLGVASADVPGRTRGLTGFVYKSVRGVTGLVAAGLDTALGLTTALDRTSAESSFERDAAISALNGVLGDHLAHTKNSLAIEMSMWCGGKLVDAAYLADAITPPSRSKLAIFVHGLCMNERQWHERARDTGEARLIALGYTPIYLRYNTGLHVSQNGSQLVALLEKTLALWNSPIEDIIFVAHSMGGLVTRSALAQSIPAKSSWRAKVSKAFFLGTPHQGAPLERGGHWIDLVLAATPYTRPLAKLGKIRSTGITDLRHGHVTEADWAGEQIAKSATALPADMECFAIAATTGKTKRDLRDALLGDGLVPVASALGKHRLIERRLAFDESNTWIAYERNHMDLLGDDEVFAKIENWLSRD